MWQTLYSALTARAGMYIGYLAPIIYLAGLVAYLVKRKQARKKHLGAGDLFTVLALLLVSLDFVYYGYLFFTQTGKLLQPNHLFLKYAGGGFLWVWIIGYCYRMYFAPQAAGSKLKDRYMQLVWVAVSCVVLGVIGFVMS